MGVTQHFQDGADQHFLYYVSKNVGSELVKFELFQTNDHLEKQPWVDTHPNYGGDNIFYVVPSTVQ